MLPETGTRHLLKQAIKVGYAIFRWIELNIWIPVETVQHFNQLLNEIFKPFTHCQILHKKAERSRPVETVAMLRLLCVVVCARMVARTQLIA